MSVTHFAVSPDEVSAKPHHERLVPPFLRAEILLDGGRKIVFGVLAACKPLHCSALIQPAPGIAVNRRSRPSRSTVGADPAAFPVYSQDVGGLHPQTAVSWGLPAA